MIPDPAAAIDADAISRKTYSTPAAQEIYRQKAIRAELRNWERAVVDARMGPNSGVRDVLEVRSLLAGAGFSDITIAYTDELGESWGNVFVVTVVV